LRINEGSDDYHARIGTDGCDYIHRETGEIIPCATFMTPEVEMLRRRCQDDEESRTMYENWLDNVTDALPTVSHFSWWDIERKINTYKNYWGKHWQSLYNLKTEDTAENNMFFDSAWSDVTSDMITERSKELAEKCGGWVFHSKWDGKQTASVKCARTLPKFVSGIYEE